MYVEWAMGEIDVGMYICVWSDNSIQWGQWSVFFLGWAGSEGGREVRASTVKLYTTV